MDTRNRPRQIDRRRVESAPESADVTLLFCDVVRSTELTRRLGDRGAYRVIRCFHGAVLRAAGPAHGEELELRGDGVLLAFASPRNALDCAIEIQRRLLEMPEDRRVNARIGLHTGTALRVASGYFGGNVIVSARIAEAAAPGEILISAAIVQALAPAELPVDAGRWLTLKGVPEPNLVFSLPWRSGAAPVTEPPCPSAEHEALLAALDRAHECDANREAASCILGRGSIV